MAVVTANNPGTRIQTTANPAIIGQVVCNPDGTSIATTSGTSYSTSSSSTPAFSSGTVATLTAGQTLSIQNLSTAPLLVKLGASASTSSFTYALPACTAQDDGTSPPVFIDFWTGVVSVASSGTLRYLATVLS